MAISTTLEYAPEEKLLLDPKNPRLGRANVEKLLDQPAVLDVMKDWTLDELAVSYIEGGGFWTHEAVLVVEEEPYGEPALVVVEGNRRLAALRLLHLAVENPEDATPKWRDIASSDAIDEALFERVPYLRMDSRTDVEAFLGFRHVTGIKEWRPAEKAGYITQLVDQGYTYREVMRKIGSKTPTVRQNYIAYRLLLQIEAEIEEVDEGDVERRFSVMYLSLRTRGVQSFLGLDVKAEPDDAQEPVPPSNRENLEWYSKWLFGTQEKPPLVPDSRLIDKFGYILENEEAVAYLKRTATPSFDAAYQMAGGDEPEVISLIQAAADNTELALSRVHLFKKSEKVRKAVGRFGAHADQLLRIFPDIKAALEEDAD